MLCEKCQYAEDQWGNPPMPEAAFDLFQDMLPFIQIPPVEHHESPAELKDCADKNNCPFCKLIYAAILDHQRQECEGQELPSARIVLERFGSDDGAGTNAGIQILINGGRWGSMDVYPMKDSVAKVLDKCADGEDKSTSSEAAFKIAKFWFLECRISHKNCRTHNGGVPFLPTRVVDVGPKDGSQEPRLHERRGWEKRKYFALSHRWGNSDRLDQTKTVKNNYKQYLQAIPIGSLPLTFQHAIQITREFDCRYIWIDSLCIIQDSREDWSSESQRMDAVYRRADLTLAAIDATSAESGCYSDRDGLSIRPCRVKIYRPPKEFDAYSGIPGDLFVFPKVRFDRSRSNHRRFASLDGRGWCLQERVLSTRVLSYGRDGLYWECATADASEIAPEGIERDSRSTGNEYMRVLKLLTIGVNIKSRYISDFKDPHRAWHLFAEDYSRRHLTQDTDKHIAIVGAAKSLSSTDWNIYHAGVWTKYLWRDLMWLVVQRTTVLKRFITRGGIMPPYGPLGRRLDSSVAPTWSWVSVEGSISFQTSPFDDSSKYYDVHSKFCFGTTMPDSQEPVMVAKGPLKKLKTCNCGATCDARYTEKLKKDGTTWGGESSIEHLVDEETGSRVADWFPDTYEVISKVYAIPIARESWMILVPTVGYGYESGYRRVGLAHFYQEPGPGDEASVQCIYIV
ncbi:HET-domain-containing protein [Xylariaceae sp. FL1651]|nr:HET-domain-containing protein [Xylariaceae sp. FL1651]